MKVKDKRSTGAGALKSFIQFSYGTWGLAFINILTTPVITWLIVPEELGRASMFTLLYNVLLNIALLGTDQSFCRFFYENTRSRPTLLSSSILIPLLLVLVIGVGVISSWDFLSTLMFGQSEPVTVALILVFTLLSGVIYRFGLLSLRMYKSANSYSILQIINGVLNVTLIVGYSWLVHKSYEAIIIAFLISTSCSALITISIQYKLWKRAVVAVDSELIKKTIFYGLPFVPAFILEWLFQASDRFFLRYYMSFEDIGIYAASFKIVAALNLLQSGFNLFWVPFSYELFSKNPEERGTYAKVFNFLSAALLAVIVMLMLFKNIIASILADSYSEAAYIIPFLLFIPVLYTISEVTVVGINLKKKTYFHLYISLFAFISNVLLNFLLIPAFGIKGAAIATGLSYFVFFVSRTFYSQSLFKINYAWSRFTCALVIAFCCAIVHSFMEQSIYSLSLGIVGMLLVILLFLQEWKEMLQIAKSRLKLKA
ncbi:oligosaccharide flippase family protein [Pontibacter akesuensis]|uniref:Membrane protein involved in the export of O-antigen and teichoic acid n=1 Tax=Pontibacter akesuensis TaxID=388950 RepID=A0A1I7GBJ1_9BACT|nr:oligosaccharide flippase family protein [Pontibacter akesuensis]SFU45819.1 Membrane protein involved in the export of O-antigen and teichoic acid [Pontibacter akesuensis]